MNEKEIYKIKEALKTKTTEELENEYYFLKSNNLNLEKVYSTYFRLIINEMTQRNHIVYKPKYLKKIK